ncbi:hypothetical protein [Nostoc sp.]|uniref:hypothetical protein n=1 Tax=Nostoc sp. TaxID=1180 RepID=UPI002FF39B9C
MMNSRYPWQYQYQGEEKMLWEHPVLADRPALRRTLREQTRSLGLYKQNPPTRVSESPRRRTKVCVAAISNRPVFLPKVDAPNAVLHL